MSDEGLEAAAWEYTDLRGKMTDNPREEKVIDRLPPSAFVGDGDVESEPLVRVSDVLNLVDKKIESVEETEPEGSDEWVESANDGLQAQKEILQEVRRRLEAFAEKTKGEGE